MYSVGSTIAAVAAAAPDAHVVAFPAAHSRATMFTVTQSATFLGGVALAPATAAPSAKAQPKCVGAPSRLAVQCKKDILGKVVSVSSDKTAVVEVERKFAHKL